VQPDAVEGLSAAGRKRRARSLAGIVCAALLSLPVPARSQGATNSAAGADWSFPVGEELTYAAYWGFIPVGKVRIVTRWAEVDGRTLLAIRYRARSNRVLSAIYPVDSVIEALVDPATFRPVRFTKSLNEGRHHKYEVTTYDFTRLQAHCEKTGKGLVKEYAIEQDTRDLVTFTFYMRRHQFQVGSNQQFRVSDDDKMYDLTVNVLKEERVDLSEFGKVNCTKLEPLSQLQGVFVRKGRMFLWVAPGERCVVTKIEASLPVANVRAVLQEVRGPGDDFWVRKTAENLKKNAKDVDPEVEKALKELDEGPLRVATTDAPAP
jgi:hypothetical protein